MNSKNPKHIAIILDGNKRWASKNNLSVLEGYKGGLDKIKIITQVNLEKRERLNFFPTFLFKGSLIFFEVILWLKNTNVWKPTEFSSQR